VRDMNLNTIRFEGKLEDDHFFDLMDEMGYSAMPGWCCCDNWERWPAWSGEEKPVAVASLRDQIQRLERHPSVFTFLYGSDRTPPPEVEKKYLQVLKRKRLAQSGRCLGGELHHHRWADRSQDGGALRVGCSGLLGDRHQARRGLWLCHRDQSWAGHFRPSRACGVCCRKITCGPSIPYGITTPAECRSTLKIFTEAAG